MPSFDAGSISSRLELDRSPFTASLSIARSMAAQFEASDFEATLKGNINPLLAAVRSARASLQNFSRESYEATITAQTRRAEERIASLQNDLREVGRERQTATVDANTRPGRRALTEYDRVIRRYNNSWNTAGLRTRVTADIRRAAAQLRMLERQLKGVTDPDHRVTVEAETLRARQRLEGLQRTATALGLRSPTISVGIRGRAATMASMLGLQRMADRLDGYNIRFRASVDQSLSRALPNLLGALEMQVARYRTIMTAAAAVAMPLFYSSLAAIPAVASAAAGAIGSLASAIAQGLAGGAGIAATAAVQGLAGGLSTVAGAAGLGGAALYAYGRAVSGTISYVGDLTDTIKAQITQVDDANKVLSEARTRLDDAAKGTREYDNALKGVKLAQEQSRYEQARLNALYDIATPRVLRLQRRVNNARLGLLRFGGAIMHEVTPALLTGMNEFSRFSGRVREGALGMARDMTAVSQEFIRAAARGQNLASITAIMRGIRSAGVPALRAVGNSALLAVNLLAPLVPHSLAVLNHLSRLTGQANRWSQTEAGQRRIAEVWALLAEQGRRLGRVAWNTGRILFRVFAPATPYAQAFLGYLVRITNKAAEWAESARGQERIAGTWQKLARRGQWLWRVAVNLGAALWGVLKALEDSGTVDFMATSVERLTKRFRNFMSATGEGRTKIIEFMRDARPILVAAASLAKEAADQFFRIADEIISFREEGSKLTVLEEIFQSIEKSLKPLADFLIYEFKKIAPLIGPFIEELSTWFATMARSQPEMKFFIQFLTDMLGLFNSLPYETQRNIARIIAYTAAIKALGGGAVLGGIASLAATVVQWRMLSRIWRNMPKQPPVAPPPVAPGGPVVGPAGGGRTRRMAPPVVPAPVPARGFWQTFKRRIGRTPPVVAPTVPAPAPARGFWRRMPRTAPPIVAPTIPAPVPARGFWRKAPKTAPPMVAPTIPAPVPGRGFAPTATRRVAGTGIAAAIGGFFSRMWSRIPFSAQLGRAFSRIRLGGILRSVGAWGGRIGGALLGGLGRLLFGPVGFAALIVDMLTGGSITEGIAEFVTDFIDGFKKQWNKSGNWLSGLFWGLLGGIWESLNFGDMVEEFKRRYRQSLKEGNVGALGSETVSAIANGLLGALSRVPLIGPFIGWLDRNIAKPIKDFFEIGSPSKKAARWGRWIVEGLLEGIKDVPVIGGMVEKAQRLYQGARQAFRRGGWRGLGAWAVNQIAQGLKQTPLGGIATKAQRAFNGARQAFRRNGWRGLGTWAIGQIAAGLRGTRLGGIAAKVQGFFNGARQAFRRGGWRGLGAYVVNSISGGLRGTRFYNFGVKVQNFFRGARLAFRRGGWRGLGVYVVNRISAGLRGTRFYNFAVKVANFFRGARAAYRRQGWRGLGAYVVNTISGGLRGTRFYNFGVKVQNFFNGARSAFRRRGFRGLGVYVINAISNGIKGTRLGGLVDKVFNMINDFNAWRNRNRPFKIIGNNMIVGIVNGWNAVNVAGAFINKIANGLQALRRWLLNRSPSKRTGWIGRDMGRGLAVGMEGEGSNIARAARRMGQRAHGALVREMEIQSPSRVFARLGLNLGAGLAGGIRSSTNQAVNAALDMARRVAAAAQVRANVAVGAKPGATTRPVAKPALRPVLRPAPKPVPRPVLRPPAAPKPPTQPAGPPLIQPILNLTVPVQQDMDAAEEKAVEAAVATVKEAFAEVRKQATSNGGYLAGEVS